jgi:N-acetylglucosaminyldiphosphoundecaprenol N-acetyl-beta-D-mannosaminyltransferase
MLNFFGFYKYQNKLHKIDTIQKKIVVFMNPHSYVSIFKDKLFYNAIKNCTDIYVDGVGIYLLLKLKFFFLNKKLRIQKITGYDYFTYIINNAYKKKILLLGTTASNLVSLKNRILINNPSCKIYTLNVPFVENFENKHLKSIFRNFKHKKIDYCFVATGAPKQEKFAQLIWSGLVEKKKLNINIIASVGAVFDYYAKNLSFVFFTSRFLNLEWLYRLINNVKLWKRIFVSVPQFLNLIIFSVMPRYYNLTFVANYNKLITARKSFILTAFNLAAYSYIFKKKIEINKHMFFWQDGIFSKFFLKNYKKLPGRKLVSNLKIPKSIKKIHVIGNLKQQSKTFLEITYKIQISHTQLPFGSINKILKYVPKTQPSELVLITLPTPKQEIVANYLTKKNRKFKIICIGGGLAIASKEELPCPLFLEKIYLEFFWRLQYQTKRRLLRLTESFYLLISSAIFLFSYRISINEK